MASEWVPDIGERVQIGKFEAVVVSVSLEMEIVTVLVHRPHRTEPRPYATTFETARSRWTSITTSNERG